MITVASAVHNNAIWCDALCRALGCDTAMTDGLWVNRSPSPPYYSNAVTMDRDAEAVQLGRVRSMLSGPLPRPWTIKDGFHVLDLAPLAFEVLFDAEWIGLDADAPMSAEVASDVAWAPTDDVAGLANWEAAWRGGNDAADTAGLPRMFQPALLADPDIRFLAGWQGGSMVAVAIANRSDDGSGPVVGISNIVLPAVDPEQYRAGAVTAVRDAFPGLPMVGYERGDDLKTMGALGFGSLGPLRVWISPA
jgi:hypothetical protein